MMPDDVVKKLADRAYRMRHYLWHAARENWPHLEVADRQNLEALNSDFVPLRPSLNENGQARVSSEAGLDFLLMHRCMIADVNGWLNTHGRGPVEGWQAPPKDDDGDFPVPRGDLLPESRYPSKNNDCWAKVVKCAERLEDPVCLRNMSVHELGTRIEYGIHAEMHVRFGDWGKPPRWVGRTPPPRTYDHPDYNSLFFAYSAHVHPWFWKIHGWIDDRFKQWEQENDTNFLPQDGWMGPMSHGKSHATDEAEMARLEAAAAILIRSGADGTFRPRSIVE